MGSRRRLRSFGILFLVLGAGGLGLLAGLVLYLATPNIAPAPVPATLTETTTFWSLTFRHDFGSTTLSAGTHTYDMGISCPEGFESGSYQGSIKASEGAEVGGDPVFLRPDGVWTQEQGGEATLAVSTEQHLTATVTLTFATQAQAEEARSECKVSIRLDFSQSERLSPDQPEEMDLEG